MPSGDHTGLRSWCSGVPGQRPVLTGVEVHHVDGGPVAVGVRREDVGHPGAVGRRVGGPAVPVAGGHRDRPRIVGIDLDEDRASGHARRWRGGGRPASTPDHRPPGPPSAGHRRGARPRPGPGRRRRPATRRATPTGGCPPTTPPAPVRWSGGGWRRWWCRWTRRPRCPGPRRRPPYGGPGRGPGPGAAPSRPRPPAANGAGRSRRPERGTGSPPRSTVPNQGGSAFGHRRASSKPSSTASTRSPSVSRS